MVTARRLLSKAGVDRDCLPVLSSGKSEGTCGHVYLSGYGMPLEEAGYVQDMAGGLHQTDSPLRGPWGSSAFERLMPCPRSTAFSFQPKRTLGGVDLPLTQLGIQSNYVACYRWYCSPTGWTYIPFRQHYVSPEGACCLPVSVCLVLSSYRRSGLIAGRPDEADASGLSSIC